MGILKKLFYEQIWAVAYRKIEATDYENFEEGEIQFRLIRNPRLKWYADPFVIKHGKETYLFVEAMDRKKSRAHIEYFNLSESVMKRKFKSNVALKESFHLSYPCVFKFDNEMYMIPESVADKSILIYKSTNFPQKWCKTAKLASGNYVDTTFFLDEGVPYILSYIPGKINQLFSMRLSKSMKEVEEIKTRFEYDKKIGRPAGNLCYENGFIRPTQYGVNYYGEKIDFYRLNLSNNEEKYLKSIDVSNIRVSGIKSKIHGIHTINRDEDFEVIDIQYLKFYLFRPILLLLKKIHLFGYSFL